MPSVYPPRLPTSIFFNGSGKTNCVGGSILSLPTSKCDYETSPRFFILKA